MRATHRCLLSFIVALIAIGPFTIARADDPAADYTSIRRGMSKLAPVVGKWRAVALFHDGAKISEREGTYDVQWTLDNTYLEYRVELHRKDDPSHSNGFFIYITYNPATHQYDSTYFYTRWALRVTETGQYDDDTHQFRTKAFIPREDGVRDENVRTVTDLNDPKKIVYTHYSRYSDEPKERMNLEITLTPVAK